MNCCKDCEKRKIGCHSKCDLYKEYQVRLKQIKKNKRKEIQVAQYVAERRQRIHRKLRWKELGKCK